MLSTMEAKSAGNYEDNMTGEPNALKGAHPIRKGTERKGLATIPRS